MATTGIRVTPEQLQQISAQLDAARPAEGTLRQLAANVAPSGPTGPASPRPGSSSSGPVAAQRHLLQQALTGIARLTARAGASYESAEHGIAASFGRP